jgi:glucose-1-phosphate thymidylyltransferase
VLATLLRELAAVRVGPVTIVVGHLGEHVEALAGDGSAFGVEVRYVRQPEPVGSADAVRRALAAGARPPLLVSAADTVFRSGALRSAAERWLSSGAEGGLGVRRSADPDKTAVEVADGRVVRLGEGSDDLAAAPLWFLGEGLADSLQALPGPPFELSLAFQRAIDAGREILALELGPTRDLTRPEDVLLANFPYLWRSRR